MTKVIQCITPIDGSVYLERQPLDIGTATPAVARVAAAQVEWARRPLQDRIDLVLAGVKVLGEMSDYLNPALCWTGCKNTGRGGGLSIIGFHNLTRSMSIHFKKS